MQKAVKFTFALPLLSGRLGTVSYAYVSFFMSFFVHNVCPFFPLEYFFLIDL